MDGNWIDIEKNIEEWITQWIAILNNTDKIRYGFLVGETMKILSFSEMADNAFNISMKTKMESEIVDGLARFSLSNKAQFIIEASQCPKLTKLW